MYGKVLIAGGYLVLNSAYSGVVLRAYVQIKCEVAEAESTTIITKFGKYPKVENLYLKACIFVVKIYLEIENMIYKPLQIIVNADPRFYMNGKLGLGSSSALCASVVQAILNHHGITNANEIFKVASIAHFKAQGKVGSGFDIAAAVFGSCIYRKPLILEDMVLLNEAYIMNVLGQDWFLDIIPFEWPKEWQILLFSFSTGESTILNTKLFLEWTKKTTGCISQLDTMEFLTQQLITSIRLKDPQMLKSTFIDIVDQYTQLGAGCGIDIIPKQCQKLFKSVFDMDSCIGGMCPGAGGKDAIFLISDLTNNNELIDTAKEHGFTLVNIDIG